MGTSAESTLLTFVAPLRGACSRLREWLDRPSVLAVPDSNRKSLRESLDEIEITLDKWEAEPLKLVVVLLGGTGVGKSSLLNALAGQKIATSSLVRPTTQVSTIYHHVDIDLSRLPKEFEGCQAITHERAALRNKIIVDTPDIDGSVVEHHDRLKRMLPMADAILYVGSQEKYHDRAAWQLLVELAPTRGFAFVLNKWDRCLAGMGDETGTPVDKDFLRSLREAGFDSPLFFRVSAKQWESTNRAGQAMVEDDFVGLQTWLQSELDERAIREIKSRGLQSLLAKSIEELSAVVPTEEKGRRDQLSGAWRTALRAGVADQVALLVESADRQAVELERHFSFLGRKNVKGIFGIYLHLVENVLHMRATLLQLPSAEKKTEMQTIASRCVQSVPTSTRDTKQDALRDRLMALADRQGWPIDVLRDYLSRESTVELSAPVLAESLSQELRHLESDFLAPQGGRRALHALVHALCRWTPEVVLGAIGVSLVYSLITFQFWGVGEFFSAVLLFGLTLAGLHFLLVRVFPVRWDSLRERLRGLLEENLMKRISPGPLRALDRYAEDMASERKELEGVSKSFSTIRSRLVDSAGEEPSPLYSRRSNRRA